MKNFWDRIAGAYDLAEALNAGAYREMLRAVAEWVSPGSRVMDCAAGTGALSQAAAEKADYVLCTDLSQAMLERAMVRMAQAGNVEYARRDIFAPAPEKRFDAVIAGNILHLLEEPEAAVDRLAQCVHTGGRLILPTFLQGECGAAARALIRAYGLLGFRARSRFTLDSYRTMLEGCGAGRIACMRRIGGLVPVGFAVIEKI